MPALTHQPGGHPERPLGPQIQGITPNGAVCGGQPLQVSVQATGTGLAYQWYRQAGSATQPISGATSATATIPAQFLPGTLYAVVRDGCGLDSAFVTLTIKPPTTLRVTSQVASVCEGGILALSVSGSGPGSLSYAWRKDGGPVLSTAPSLTLTGTQPADAGSYVCTLTSECQSQAVNIPVTVRSVRITSQPQSVNVCAGSTTLTVGVQAVGLTPTYQWRRNGTPIAGVTGASLTVQASRPGTYTVEVRSACGNVVSDPATVSCGNSRLSAEEPELVVVPNPVVGGAIRVRVSGMDNPGFGLATATGQSLGVSVKTDPGSPGGGWVLTPRQTLPTGVYILRATERGRHLTQRLIVVE